MSIFRPLYAHPIRFVHNASWTTDVTFYTRIDGIHFPMGVLMACDLMNDEILMYSDYVFDFVFEEALPVTYELSVLAPHVIDDCISL